MSTRFTLLLMFAAAGLGCSTTRVCAPGATQACVCPSAAHGAQSCAADGSHWEQCTCTGGASAPATSPAAPQVVANAGSTPPAVPACPAIRDIDWMNRSYSFASWGDPAQPAEPLNGNDEIRLRQGRFEVGSENDLDEDFIEYSADPPIFGDLTGDGRDEAVVALKVFDRGNDPPRWLQVFTIRECQVVSLGMVPSRASDEHEYNSLESERVENGRIVLERQDWSEGGAHCCPHHVRTEYWRVRGEEMVEDSRARVLRRVLPEAHEP